MSFQLFWGDLHSHCSISYGHGSAEQALLRAQRQLDFCSITGHAFWPDMPTDRSRYADIIDYHRQGFRRLAENWPRLLELNKQHSRAAEFLTFPSYEWHSAAFGDHNVYAMDDNLELQDAATVGDLRNWADRRGAIVIPHHIGYAAGFRGINWEGFSEKCSPFVEIFSLHGCSLSEMAPYPMLHDMGPRDFGSTAEAGWQRGFRFGIVGGTDHHGAYPGSHGDGRMGVFAKELTRESLWEAMLQRRVFAATGDRIDARMWIDGAWIGSELENAANRSIRIQVRGCDALDKAQLVKNGRIIGRFFAKPTIPDASRNRYRLRVTWGWGRREELVDWNGEARINVGKILKVESCFSGQAIVAPQAVRFARPVHQGSGQAVRNLGATDSRSEQAVRNLGATDSHREQAADAAETPDDQDLPHDVTDQGQRHVAWRSRTQGNLSMRHATTQALSLEIEAPLDATLDFEINGIEYRHTLASLLRAGRTHYQRGWLSEAVRIGPLVPLEECQLSANVIDAPENEVDVYRLEVSQLNGQWAWLTPIWVRR